MQRSIKIAVKVVETWTGPGKTDGRIEPLLPIENAVHPNAHHNYFEHWYFDAILEDGHVAIGFLQASELIRRKPGVELHVFKPDGTRLQVARNYPSSDVSASEKAFDVRIGDNRGWTEPGGQALPVHRLQLAEEDIAFDLTFENEVPGWKPGGGMTRYGDADFFAWVVPAPRAKVSGTVTLDGDLIPARGTGYSDHNWGVGDMKRIVSYWYWGRIYAEDFTILYAHVATGRRYGYAISFPVMVAHRDRVILSTGEATLRTGATLFNAGANREYPSSLAIEIPGIMSLELKVQDVLDTRDLLDDVPVLRSGIIKPLFNRLVGRPGYLRFRSEFEFALKNGGETFHRSGTTLHEMVALR